MRLSLTALCALIISTSVYARGILIPKDKAIPPLAMLRHEVSATIEDQAATTRVEQTFRNHTDRALEATYVFPVPRGGSVHALSMWVNGKEVKGELVEAERARAIYTETVQRAMDPALLEYLGNDVFRLKVFPVPARGDVKLALTFTTALPRDAGVVEYLYPFKTSAASALEKFALKITLKSSHGIQNIYSPTHAVSLRRASDREATIQFDESHSAADRDFQLLYTLGEKDVGVTLLAQRPAGTAKGHFMLLLSPRAELPKQQHQPRDFVLVLDVSGSMAGNSIRQAKNALKFVLERLDPRDRFGIITFSDTVNRYGSELWDAGPANIARARQWVDGIEAVGGTNINDALLAALDLRDPRAGRSFTVVFFTDGLPTVGVTDPAAIVKNVLARNTASTRIFTFGVGHDVNATLLDQLALGTRAASAYVRPAEDIEARVSSLFAKIHRPVLVNLNLSVGKEVVLEEMYPPKLPDLFHGGQLMVLGKYSGHGRVKLKLEGMVGKDKRICEYEVDFPEKTTREREVIENIWARRKIGFLLDQVRAGGEKPELVDSVVSLARRYGIATPYTSYLAAPESPLPSVGFGPGTSGAPGRASSGGPLRGQFPLKQPPIPVNNFGPYMPGFLGGSGGKDALRNAFRVKQPPAPAGNLGSSGLLGGSGAMGFNFGGGFGGGGFSSATGTGNGRIGGGMHLPGSGMMGGGMMGMTGGYAGSGMMGIGGTLGTGSLAVSKNKRPSAADWARLVRAQPTGSRVRQNAGETAPTKTTLDQARAALGSGQHQQTQSGQLGVDLSIHSNKLRNETRLTPTAQRRAAGRILVNIGGVWIDEALDEKTKTYSIKAFSPAYFRLLERQPEVGELFRLGNLLVWVTPSGNALAIDPEHGQDHLDEPVIDRLFKVKAR